MASNRFGWVASGESVASLNGSDGLGVASIKCGLRVASVSFSGAASFSFYDWGLGMASAKLNQVAFHHRFGQVASFRRFRGRASTVFCRSDRRSVASPSTEL